MVTDLDDGYGAIVIRDRVEDAVVALRNSVEFVCAEFLAASGLGSAVCPRTVVAARRQSSTSSASSSLTADGLISSLERSTAPQVLENSFEFEAGLLGSGSVGGKILGVLREVLANCVVDEIGDAPIRLGGLHPKGSMEIRVEIDCCAS